HGAIGSFAQIVVEPSIRRKILSKDIFSFRLSQPGHDRETLRADAVDDSKIQALRKVALFLRNLIGGDIENLGGGYAMQVGSGIERADEFRITRELRQDAKLDLRVISNHQLPSFGVPAETATVFNRMRHLLNVGIGTREAPG